MAECIDGYRDTDDYRRLSYSTKLAYERSLGLWGDGATKLPDIEPRALRIRNNLLEDGRRATARLFITATQNAAFFLSLGHLMPLKDTRPRSRWPDEVVDLFLGTAKPHLQLACLIGLHTAQRIGDVVAMRWSDLELENGKPIGWHVTQEKTGRKLYIPLAKPLAEALEKPVDGGYIVRSARGPMTARSLSMAFLRALNAIGVKGYTFHGLRKTAAARLAEAGASTEEIKAITGHKTLAMVQLYTEEANQVKLAKAAMKKING